MATGRTGEGWRDWNGITARPWTPMARGADMAPVAVERDWWAGLLRGAQSGIPAPGARPRLRHRDGLLRVPGGLPVHCGQGMACSAELIGERRCHLLWLVPDAVAAEHRHYFASRTPAAHLLSLFDAWTDRLVLGLRGESQAVQRSRALLSRDVHDALLTTPAPGPLRCAATTRLLRLETCDHRLRLDAGHCLISLSHGTASDQPRAERRDR